MMVSGAMQWCMRVCMSNIHAAVCVHLLLFVCVIFFFLQYECMFVWMNGFRV